MLLIGHFGHFRGHWSFMEYLWEADGEKSYECHFMKTSQPEYHLMGLFGKVCDFFVIEDSRETPTSDAIVPATSARLLPRLQGWLDSHLPSATIVCVSKTGSHFNPTLKQDPACTITHQTESGPLVAEKSCFKIISDPQELINSKLANPQHHKIMPTFGPYSSYQAKETKGEVFYGLTF